MFFRGSRLLRLLLVVPLLSLLFLVRRQIHYEGVLAASSITFDDFPVGYPQALRTAQLRGETPRYEWPGIAPASVDSTQDERTTIPPIIHFIWFKDLYHEHLDVSQIPHKGSRAPDACRFHNPDYEIITWNQTAARSLLENHYPSLIPLYDGYRYPIQQIDLFKYVLLWHYGGIYMDLDIACRHELDALLPFLAWYPKALPFGVNNDLMASRARHPFVGYMLDRLEGRNWNLFFPYLTIFWSTGPQFTSDMLSSWFRKQTNTYVHGTGKAGYGKDMVYVLPQEFYSEKYTFFGHGPGGTWHGQDVAVVLWFVAHPFAVALPAVLCCLAAVFVCLKVRRQRAGLKV
ncbi:hypothetical protein MBLNU230_g6677t1 [Neophaeotheca triangularis]